MTTKPAEFGFGHNPTERRPRRRATRDAFEALRTPFAEEMEFFVRIAAAASWQIAYRDWCGFFATGWEYHRHFGARRMREKSGTSLGVTGAEPVQGSGADGRSCAASGCRRIVRGRTGFSPAHPFGSLAATGAPAEGPWLCVAVFRRVCPFEDERRFGSKRDAAACPRKPPLTPAEPFALSTLGRNRGLRNRPAFA